MISATFLTNELIVVGVERDNMHVVDSKNGATVRLLAEIESPHSIEILADPGMLRNIDGTIISTHIAHSRAFPDARARYSVEQEWLQAESKAAKLDVPEVKSASS